MSEIEKQIEKRSKKLSRNRDYGLVSNIKEQMAAALEDSKIATTQLINEAENRLRDLRDGSEAAIKKISEELASEIINKISKEK